MIANIFNTYSNYGKEIQALVIFFLFILIALLFKFVIVKILDLITKKTKNEFDNEVLDLVKNPIFETIILIGLILTFKKLGLNHNFIDYSIKAVLTFIFIIWTILINKIFSKTIRIFIHKHRKHHLINNDNLPLILNLQKIFLLIISIIAILSSWELDLTPLLASAGIISVIIGFAAKDTIANLLGGISVIIDKPYRIGDWIELDQNERGEVVEIGLRSTRIRTRDDILIAIPNSIISNTKITNESAPYHDYRLRVPISLHYNTDLDFIEEILTEIARNHELVLKEPFPRVRFREFASSTIDCELLCWTNQPADRGLIIHNLIKDIYKKFNELKIEFPYQQIDIKIKS